MLCARSATKRQHHDLHPLVRAGAIEQCAELDPSGGPNDLAFDDAAICM
jgi:hypothetical protein